MSKETKNVSIDSTEKSSDVILLNEKELLTSTTASTCLTTSFEKKISLKTKISSENMTTPSKTKVPALEKDISSKSMTPEKITTPIKSKISTPEKIMSPKTKMTSEKKTTLMKGNISTEITTSMEVKTLEEFNPNFDKKRLPIEDDVCDCPDVDCPGCFFPCESCGSNKCGHQCRIGREWKRYESYEIQGRDMSNDINEDDLKEMNDTD